MFAYIIIYNDVIGPIFAKLIAKMFDSAKVRVSQRVIQCTHVGSCKKGSAVLLMLMIKIPKFGEAQNLSVIPRTLTHPEVVELPYSRCSRPLTAHLKYPSRVT